MSNLEIVLELENFLIYQMFESGFISPCQYKNLNLWQDLFNPFSKFSFANPIPLRDQLKKRKTKVYKKYELIFDNAYS